MTNSLLICFAHTFVGHEGLTWVALFFLMYLLLAVQGLSCCSIFSVVTAGGATL